MTSFCNCFTCQKIKARIKAREGKTLCNDCGQIHADYETYQGLPFCPYILNGGIQKLKIGKYTKQDTTTKNQHKFIYHSHPDWATSKDFPNEKK